jgi:uncharacterized membrane protein
MKLFHVPLGSIVFVLSTMILTLLYQYFSFALLHGIRLRDITKKGQFAEVPKLQVAGAVLIGIALSVGIIGVVFKMQSWPSAHFLLIVGTIILVFAFALSFFYWMQSRQAFFKRTMWRVGIVGALTLGLLLYPRKEWISLRYSDYPEYVKAAHYALDHPSDTLALQNMLRERELMYAGQRGGESTPR